MLIGIVPGTCGPGHAQHARASAWNQILMESGSPQGFPLFGLLPQGRWPIMSKIDAHLSFLYVD